VLLLTLVGLIAAGPLMRITPIAAGGVPLDNAKIVSVMTGLA